jgi:hypothetical protein
MLSEINDSIARAISKQTVWSVNAISTSYEILASWDKVLAAIAIADRTYDRLVDVAKTLGCADTTKTAKAEGNA